MNEPDTHACMHMDPLIAWDMGSRLASTWTSSGWEKNKIKIRMINLTYTCSTEYIYTWQYLTMQCSIVKRTNSYNWKITHTNTSQILTYIRYRYLLRQYSSTHIRWPCVRIHAWCMYRYYALQQMTGTYYTRRTYRTTSSWDATRATTYRSRWIHAKS